MLKRREIVYSKKFFITTIVVIVILSLIELAGWGMILYVRNTSFTKLKSTKFYTSFVDSLGYRMMLPEMLIFVGIFIILEVFILLSQLKAKNKLKKASESNQEVKPRKRLGRLSSILALVFVLAIGAGGGFFIAHIIEVNGEKSKKKAEMYGLLSNELVYNEFSEIKDDFVDDGLFRFGSTYQKGMDSISDTNTYPRQYRELFRDFYDGRFIQSRFDIGYRERHDLNSDRIDRRSVLGEEACTFELNKEGGGYTVTNLSTYFSEEEEESSGLFHGSSYKKYDYRKVEIIIPETYEGLPVTKIKASALFDYSKRIEEITFPSTMKEIIGVKYGPEETIPHQNSLKVLNLNEGLEIIGDNAFRDYVPLHALTIPSTVKSIEGRTLDGLKLLYKGDIIGNTSKASYAYKVDDVHLTEMDGTLYGVVDNELVALAPSAHNDTYVHLIEETDIEGNHYHLSKIAPNAFAYSEALVVQIPLSVSSVGDKAFYGSNIRLFGLFNPSIVCGYNPFPNKSTIILSAGMGIADTWDENYGSNINYTHYYGKTRGADFFEKDGVYYVSVPNVMGDRHLNVVKVSPFVHELTIPYSVGEVKVEEIDYYSIAETFLTKLNIAAYCTIKKGAISCNFLLEDITSTSLLAIQGNAIENIPYLKNIKLSSVTEMGTNFKDCNIKEWATLDEGVYYLAANANSHSIMISFQKAYGKDHKNLYWVSQDTEFVVSTYFDSRLDYINGEKEINNYRAVLKAGKLKSVYAGPPQYESFQPKEFFVESTKDVIFGDKWCDKYYTYSETQISDGNHYHYVNNEPVVW